MFKKAISRVPSMRVWPALFIAGFAGIGIAALIFSKALAPTGSIEPERGMQAGSIDTGIDPHASGRGRIKFGPERHLGNSPSGESMPMGDLPGWRQIFTEDFPADAPLGSFDSVYAAKWETYPRWPDTSGRHHNKRSGYYTDRVVSVKDGILNKHLHSGYDAKGDKGAGNYMMGAALMSRIHGPGTPGGRGQVYGRYSVRLRADAVRGYKIAWLLWPDSNIWPRDGEIDFAETDLTDSLGAFIHHKNAAKGTDQTVFRTPNVRLSSGWRTVTLEWQSTLKIYVDGVLVNQTSHRIPNIPMHLVLQTESALTPKASTASGHLQLDWVAIWAPQ